MELILHISAGALVGFAIGITGVGGGSLMTPLLLLFGYPAPVAIGTDLLYAAITKAGGALSHHRAGNVDWSIVRLLALGSVPTAILVHAAISQTTFQDSPRFAELLTFSLGIMLIVTAIILIFRNKLGFLINVIQRRQAEITFSMGILLGVCVTLSSVGAGAFAAAILMMIYAQARSVKIIGSDIAHAVPLTFIAGLGYLLAGYVDLMLLLSLLAGSLPAIALGSRLSNRVPEKTLQTLLTVILLGLGLYYTLFNKLH
jgi:uncharacterized membrane protein YfcA